jgi:hypothetical protein
MAAADCKIAALTSDLSAAIPSTWQHMLKTRIANLKNWLLD